MSTLNDTIFNTAEHIRPPYKTVWLAILFAFGISPAIMAGLESGDHLGLLAAWIVIATTLILFLGLRPTNLIQSAGLGGIVAFFMDTDKSQGIATGPYWLFRVVINIAFAHFMLGLIATTVDFKDIQGGFFAAWFIGLGFALWNLKFTAPAKWYLRITLGVLLACVAGLAWQWLDPDSSTGENWWSNDTGEALVVGYYSDGDFVVDPLGRTATECEASTTGCFYKGIELVKPKVEDTPDTSGFGLNTLVDAVTQTPAEKAAEAAAAQAVIDAQNARAAEIEAARERERINANKLKFAPCTGVYARAEEEGRISDCQIVTMRAGGEIYVRDADPNWCLITTDLMLRTNIDLTGPENVPDGKAEAYNVTAISGVVTGPVFNLIADKTFQRETC